MRCGSPPPKVPVVSVPVVSMLRHSTAPSGMWNAAPTSTVIPVISVKRSISLPVGGVLRLRLELPNWRCQSVLSDSGSTIPGKTPNQSSAPSWNGSTSSTFSKATPPGIGTSLPQ